MVKVRFFGMLRLDIKESNDLIEAGTIDDLLKALAEKYEKVNIRQFRNSVIFVNGINMNELKGYRTRLKDGDEVMLLSSVSGG